MKKIIYALLTAVFVISCSTEDNFDVNNYNGGIELTYFTGTPESRNVIVAGEEDSNVNVEIGSTIRANADRSYSISVTEDSPVQEGSIFMLSSGTAVIPAGEFVSSVTLQVDFDELPDEGIQVELALDGEGVADFDNVVMVNIIKQCPVPGNRYEESTWLVNSTVCAGDGAGNCDPGASDIPVQATVVMTAGDEPDEFNLSDITGGLYAQLYGASDQPGMIFEICEELNLVDQPDTVFGGDLFNGTGSVTLDDEGNIIEFTLDWSNGWGDAGTSTFTPAN